MSTLIKHPLDTLTAALTSNVPPASTRPNGPAGPGGGHAGGAPTKSASSATDRKQVPTTEADAHPIRALASQASVIAAWARQDPEGLPVMATWNLAGPRRAKQNRGGATSLVTTVRGIIRCPLLYRVAEQFPRQTTGRPSPPAEYWLFYGQVARELRSFEAADQELLEMWEHVVLPEFAAQGVQLPAADRENFNPIPGYAGFQRWRKKHLIKGGLIAQAIDANRDAMLELGALIAVAEDTISTDPLAPGLAQIIASDASVFRTASEVREVIDTVDGQKVKRYPGSRATPEGKPRPDVAGGRYGKVKKHGVTDGLYHVAICTKGYSTYTRLVLDVTVAAPGQAESDAAVPRLHRVLSAAPEGYFETLAYDGQIYPRHGLELLKRFGVYVTNHNAIKKEKSWHDSAEYSGYTRREHGQYRGRTVQTYHASLPTQRHLRADGTPCLHHLVSDDGAVFPADRARGTGVPKKTGPVIPPRALRRERTPSGFVVHLDYVIDCPHGPLTYTVEITETIPRKDGSVSWSSTVAAHRVIPEAWIERFRAVFGARNQTESFFSWLEQRFFIKDRAGSWGPDGQLVDLFCAAMLQNSEAWAHYAVRHTS